MNVRRHIGLVAAALSAAATAVLTPTALASSPAPGADAAEGARTGWRSIQVDGDAAGAGYRECDRYRA